jgi:hypothetical protein
VTTNAAASTSLVKSMCTIHLNFIISVGILTFLRLGACSLKFTWAAIIDTPARITIASEPRLNLNHSSEGGLAESKGTLRR